MKKIIYFLLIGTFVAGMSSCKKFLDINENPNSATSTTPELVLPQAIVGSATLANTFNINMADLGGQQANAGGFGGFGSVVTYEYTTASFTGLWSSTMNVNMDLKYVVDQTIEEPRLAFYASTARILKALNFARLVDQYNDIPYSEALQGTDNLTPAYDEAEDVYMDLVKELTESIEAIQAGQAANAETAGVVSSVSAATDPLFGGNMDQWKRFANTIKLRLLIKMAGVDALQSYTTEQFASFDTSVGFLTEDALVNPGYSKEAGKQAPIFASRGRTVTDANTQTSRIPSKWMIGFYDGSILDDDARGSVIYHNYPNTPSNQLGDESAGVPQSSGRDWYRGTNVEGALGVAKWHTQSQPIMLAAESYFLQAEALVRGYLSGGSTAAVTAFDSGIEASYRYLYLDANEVYQGEESPEAMREEYQAANLYEGEDESREGQTSHLVDLGSAISDAERIEGIITQKYIALNFVNNDEAYNEFRRTGYPKFDEEGGTGPYDTFASAKSRSTRADRIVGRILYPNFEYAQNGANVPSDITLFGSRIFWEIN